MGACINPRSVNRFENDIIDLEWSIKTGRRDKNESLESCKIIRPCVNFAESPNCHRGVPIDEFGSGSIKGLSEAYLSGRAIYKSRSLSYSNLITTTESEECGFFSSSPSAGTEGRGEIFSFDGTNKRVVNRYEIGLEMLKAQIHHGADPKVLKTHGERSCLMFAVLAEDFGFIKELLELGVDVNQKNRVGETALSLANELQRDDIAMYLRRKGAIESVI